MAAALAQNVMQADESIAPRTNTQIVREIRMAVLFLSIQEAQKGLSSKTLRIYTYRWGWKQGRKANCEYWALPSVFGGSSPKVPSRLDLLDFARPRLETRLPAARGWLFQERHAKTAFSQSVLPLPFHAMSRYPYLAGEHDPDDEAHRA
jgi:hypothetical protein